MNKYIHTKVLTEEERGILTIALEIARDRFRENANLAEVSADKGELGTMHRIAVQFERQRSIADQLLTKVVLADEITISEEVEA